MRTSTKAQCTAFAARHFLKITIKRFDGIWYSVDLPEGLITESGYTGKGGEEDGDMRMPEIWGAILEDMESLVWENWIPNRDN
jgi:hypothetical protein